MSKTVVVVDDDPTLLGLLEDLLLSRGVVVHSFPDGGSAMAADVWAEVDAAVIDWMMPAVSGMELVRWLADAHPHVERVLLTAAPDALLARHPGARDLAAVVAKTDVLTYLDEQLGL